MKRFTMMISVIALTVSLIGCGGSGEPVEIAGGEQEQAELEDTLKSDVATLLSGPIEGEINIYCYETFYQDFLEEAAALFEARYPGTKINVTAFGKLPETRSMTLDDGSSIIVMMSEDDPQAMSDYISRVNTEFMGGQGPDILAMDVLPYYKYAESGQLEDLRYYMEGDADFNLSDYRENIFDAVKYKGGQYLLPLDYRFYVMTYHKELGVAFADFINSRDSFTYDELSAAGAAVFEAADENTKMIDYAGAKEAFATLFMQDYERYIDIEGRAAHFTDGHFEALLEKLKAQEEQGYFRLESDEFSLDNIDWTAVMEQKPTERYLFVNQGHHTLQEMFFPDDPYARYSFGGAEYTDDYELAGNMVTEDGAYPFSYSHAYGINSNSQNKRMAWEFIKFLLGEEMQQSAQMYQNPVNQKALEAMAYRAMMQQPEYSEDGVRYIDLEGAEYEEAYRTYLAALESYSDKLNTYYVTDSVLSDMVFAEIKDYFDGIATAKETAEAIQSKVELYLNE